MEKSEDSSTVEGDPDHVGFRDGNLFIIDAIPESFDVPSGAEDSYFVQCLQAYGRILSQKLSWNRRDWMGLIFFRATEWDMDPETKHILTVQKFGEITTKMLVDVMAIVNSKVDRYKATTHEPEYPLHDVLWHAARTFDSVKVAMSRRQVILLTVVDNPFSDDEAERHRIRLRAKTFSDINVNLRILGLGRNWDQNFFFRDIEMLANNIEREDVRCMVLDDLEVQIKFEARTTSHLQLRIGEGLHIRTVISPFSRTAKYLKEVRMCKETNEVLDVFRHFGKPRSTDDESDEESEDIVTTQPPDGRRKGISCGDELIIFDQKEINKIRMPMLAGIDLLGFKKSSLDLRYHIGPTKFLGIDPMACDEEKELFTALLFGCQAKEVMAICVVNARGGPCLAKLLPCTRYGGFYLYNIAFLEQVNDLRNYIEMNIDDVEEESDELIDAEGLGLMKQVLKKLRINWNPFMFHNPKLQAQLAYIETLALDTIAEPLEDTTLPLTELMEERLGSITTKFTEIFGSMSVDSVKRKSSAAQTKGTLAKYAKFDDYTIIDTGRLEECQVSILKPMARSLGAKTTGSKAQLIERITKSYAAKNRK